MAGDFNTDLGEMAGDGRGTEIAAAITEAGLVDMTAHFLPSMRRWGRERRTWSMVREGKAIRSQTNYLLGTDRSLFRNVAVQDPRYNSDHYMVVGLLRRRTTREHIIYIAGRIRMPLTPSREPTREDTLLGDLRQAVPKPHKREEHRNAWISDDTWKLVDKRVSARRGTRVQVRLRRLGRAIKASLKGDRRRRVEEAWKAVEALLGEDPPNAKEAWRRMKVWYQAAAKRGPPPARATLERITAERTAMYSQVPTPGENIPVTVEPAEIDDSVPTEDKIAAAVENLRRYRSGGASRIRAEHLKGCNKA